MTTTPKTCVLCGQTHTGWGANPEPLARYDDGQACNMCDVSRVIPARLRALAAARTAGESSDPGGGCNRLELP